MTKVACAPAPPMAMTRRRTALLCILFMRRAVSVWMPSALRLSAQWPASTVWYPSLAYAAPSAPACTALIAPGTALKCWA